MDQAGKRLHDRPHASAPARIPSPRGRGAAAETEAGGDLLDRRADEPPEFLAQAAPLPDLRGATDSRDRQARLCGTAEGLAGEWTAMTISGGSCRTTV